MRFKAPSTDLLRRVLLVALLLPAPLAARSPALDAAAAPAPAGDPDPETRAAESREAAVDRRLLVGMWTLHLRDVGRGLDNNRLVGVAWGRYFGGTFVNSYGDRAYSAGMRGTFARVGTGAADLGLGFRAGFVTGYDERFLPIAGKTPVLPLFQLLVQADQQRVGVELAYAGVVASMVLALRF